MRFNQEIQIYSPVAGTWDKINFSWDGREFGVDNYDLESEKIALKLSGGIGEGVGTFMVALEEFISEESTVEEGLKNFKYSMRSIAQAVEKGNGVPEGLSDLAYLYLTYSPNQHLQYQGFQNCRFTYSTWSRVRSLKNMSILYMIVREFDVPDKFKKDFLCHSEPYVRAYFASNGNLRRQDMEILANDSDKDVRQVLALNDLLPGDLVSKLAKDDNIRVSMAACGNSNCSEDVLYSFLIPYDLERGLGIARRRNNSPEISSILLEHGHRGVRITLAKYSSDSHVLSQLVNQDDALILSCVIENSATNEETLIQIAQGDYAQFRDSLHNKSRNKPEFKNLAKVIAQKRSGVELGL